MLSPRVTRESPKDEKNDATSSRFVCAWAGGLRVGFEIDVVQEVLAPRAVTRLFHVPAALLGVVNLRGDILPVLDLGALLVDGPPSNAHERRRSGESDARFLVLRAKVVLESGDSRVATFAVRVARLDPLRDGGDVEPLPPGAPEAAARLARGIVGGAGPSTLIVDPDKLAALESLALLR